MSSKTLVILASLLALCFCNPQKKNCLRPAVFKDVGEVADYVKCIKTITGSPPYGKRSIRQRNPLLQKLQPILRDYGPDYVKELIYLILKSEREMQA